MLGLDTGVIFHARPRLSFSNLLPSTCRQIPCPLIRPLQTHSLTWRTWPKIKKDEQPCLSPGNGGEEEVNQGEERALPKGPQPLGLIRLLQALP